MKVAILTGVACLLSAAVSFAADEADLIIHNARVVTLDAKSTVAGAVAVRDGKIVAVGTNDDVLKLKGEKTRVLDAQGKMVLPGLYDSHSHPTSAALSEAGDPIPDLRSIPAILDFIKKRAATTPEGKWIVIRYAFPTRLKEARFPTRAELDSVSPRHPVLYHAGPAGVANSAGPQDVGRHQGNQEPAGGPGRKRPRHRRADRDASQRLRRAEGRPRRLAIACRPRRSAPR